MLMSLKSMHVTLSPCCRERCQILSLQRYGHPIRQIWIRWTIASGVSFKRGSTIRGSIMRRSWKEILTPMTLAFSCEVVHEKLWKSVNFCKSYGRKIISGTFFIWTRCIMHEVNYNSWTSYVSNYFYSHIRPEGLLYDAEHDLLAIAKLLNL